MGSKDIIELVFTTRERNLSIRSDNHIGYDEARSMIAEFMHNNLDFSDYPEKLTVTIDFKYK